MGTQLSSGGSDGWGASLRRHCQNWLLKARRYSLCSGEGVEEREVTPAGGNSTSTTWVQAVAKWRNVLCTFLVSDKQHNYGICSTECSMQYWICSFSLMHVKAQTCHGWLGTKLFNHWFWAVMHPLTMPARSLRSQDQWDESHFFFFELKYFPFWHLITHKLFGLCTSTA